MSQKNLQSPAGGADRPAQDSSSGKLVSRHHVPSIPLNLANILTSRGGREPLIPILDSLFQFLNGADLDSLIEAFPFLREALRHEQTPLPSFRCQDRPSAPSVRQLGVSADFRYLGNHGTNDRQDCEIPGHLSIPQRRCEGPAFGYAHHGDNFWVCIHCVRRAWERFNITTPSAAYDLCFTCSKAYRRGHPIPALNQCECLWNPTDKNRHFCTSCRRTHCEAQHEADFAYLRGYNSNMVPMHHGRHLRGEHPREVAKPIDRVAHFIDPNVQRGESTCICGVDSIGKLASHLPSGGAITTRDLRFYSMVRICSRCRREKFLVQQVPF